MGAGQSSRSAAFSLENARMFLFRKTGFRQVTDNKPNIVYFFL